MNIARLKALEIAGKYGNNLQDILDAEGITVIYFAFTGRLKELYFGDHIVLRSGLPERERKEMIAHALGHHFLHSGNHYGVSSGQYCWDKFQERQADVFAAYLLTPKVNNLSIQEIIDRFSVTEKFANYRLKLLEAYKQ